MTFIPSMSYEFAKMRQNEILREARLLTPNIEASTTPRKNSDVHSPSTDRLFTLRRLTSTIGDVLIVSGSSLKRYSRMTPPVSHLAANRVIEVEHA